MTKIQIHELRAESEAIKLSNAAAKIAPRDCTSTLEPSVSHTGEVIAFAARPVHFSVRGRVANTLPAVAVAPPAAGALLCRALAGAGAEGALVAFAARPHVPRAADAHPALERSSPFVAFGAVRLGLCLAATVAPGMNLHVQRVTEPHWFYHNTPSGFFTGGETYSHVERDLEGKKVAVQSCSARSSAGCSGSTCGGQNKRGVDAADFFCNLFGGRLFIKEQTLCLGVLNSADFMSFENLFFTYRVSHLHMRAFLLMWKKGPIVTDGCEREIETFCLTQDLQLHLGPQLLKGKRREMNGAITPPSAASAPRLCNMDCNLSRLAQQ